MGTTYKDSQRFIAYHAPGVDATTAQVVLRAITGRVVLIDQIVVTFDDVPAAAGAGTLTITRTGAAAQVLMSQPICEGSLNLSFSPPFGGKYRDSADTPVTTNDEADGNDINAKITVAVTVPAARQGAVWVQYHYV